MADRSKAESDPLYHTSNVKKMFDDIIEHLRQDTQKIDEPKAQALFETAAEVITGLRTAFDHYETGSERAMQAEP